MPVDLSADRLRDPVHALLTRRFRRVGVSRTRLTEDHVRRAVRTTLLRKSYCLMVTDGFDGSSARVVQPHAPDTDLTVHLGTSAPSPARARRATSTAAAQEPVAGGR